MEGRCCTDIFFFFGTAQTELELDVAHASAFAQLMPLLLVCRARSSSPLGDALGHSRRLLLGSTTCIEGFHKLTERYVSTGHSAKGHALAATVEVVSVWLLFLPGQKLQPQRQLLSDMMDFANFRLLFRRHDFVPDFQRNVTRSSVLYIQC